MALPYPEGEVFFKRSVLKKNGNGLNPDDLNSFNKHVLVEWCWNETPANDGYNRSRTKKQPGKSDPAKSFAFYDSMVVQFSTKEGFEKRVGNANGDSRHDSRHSDIKRIVKTQLPDGSEEYERRALGGPLMTALTPIELDPSQPYMYIDLTVPIRAIYFPLAQKPSKVFPDLCSYLMVDFRMRQGIQMWDHPKASTDQKEKDEEWKEVGEEDGIQLVGSGPNQTIEQNRIPMKFDLYAGLGLRPHLMISLYIPGLYNYLILPRQMRSVQRGLYMPTDPSKSLIRVHPITAINTGSDFIKPAVTNQALDLKLDMTKVLEGHLGVQVVWQPFDIPEPEDSNKQIVDMIEAGLCFIPVMGPLASTCFGLFIDIVNNPEAFKAANPFGLSGSLLGDVAGAAEAIADGLPKYSKVGKLAGFLGKIGNALTKVS